MLPHLTNRAPWFAFLLHFREPADFDRFRAGSILRTYSASEDEFQRKMCSLPPLVVGEISFGTSAVRGEVVGVMRKPEDLLGPNAVRDVADAAALAVRRGARVIGLGALTAPATGGGLRLMRHLPPGVTVTNGNAYTAALVRQNTVEVSELLELGPEAVVAVVGCTGSVGVPASRLLAEHGFRLILVGRTARRVAHELGDLAPQAVFSGDLGAVEEADVVILLTSDRSAKLAPQDVRSGSVVIDFAHPPNVPAETYGEFSRRGVVVVEGGVVRIPGLTCNLPVGVTLHADPSSVPACLAETYLLAREGIRTSAVGRPSVELARKIERVAARHGVHAFSLAAKCAPPLSASSGATA